MGIINPRFHMPFENKCESGHVYEKTELSFDVEVFRKHNKTESIYVC